MGNENNTVINKIKLTRKQVGNLFIFVGILIITTLEWHFFDWYQATTKYGTLITFAALAGAFFCYVDIKDAVRDKMFWIMAVTDVIALINLFIVGSNKGCFLIVVDFMLILYLADKVEFDRKESIVMLGYTAFFFFYWTIDVKGYFKGYNTNYGGLILITGFAFLMVLLHTVNFLKRKWCIPIYLFFIALAYNIISWYRSRTALMGLIVLLIIMIIPGKIITNKIIYPAICALASFGSIALSGLYIVFGKFGDGEVQLFYKSVVSGRNDIWSELWDAYLQKPVTGIGSSYEMKLDFMKGMFEAHSAMMDILVVHGVIVFALVCGVLLYRLIKLKSQTASGFTGKVIFAAFICILVTGFFENYYIVQPFSLMFLSLFAVKPEKKEITGE